MSCSVTLAAASVGFLDERSAAVVTASPVLLLDFAIKTSLFLSR
jgi:hypothetical protein